MADLEDRLERWRADLGAWAIPEHITAAVAESPWVLPRQVFARRADRVSAAPSGPSYRRAWAALDPPGSVLDVGAGAGAACLPLLPRATALTAVDTDAGMLDQLSQRAVAGGIPVRPVPVRPVPVRPVPVRPVPVRPVPVRTVLGRWPDAAAEAGPADVVTCHHVLYNVPEVQPFVAALTASARRTVVAEMTTQHPLVSLNALWLRFHGLRRPVSPTATDVIEILEAMGLGPGHETWPRPGGRDYATFDEMVDVTRRRLCLPPERAAEVAGALTEAGVDPERAEDLGSSGREVVTIWWDGTGGTARAADNANHGSW